MSIRFGRMTQPFGRQTLVVSTDVVRFSMPSGTFGGVARFYGGPVRYTLAGSPPTSDDGDEAMDLDERVFTSYEIVAFRATRRDETDGRIEMTYYTVA